MSNFSKFIDNSLEAKFNRKAADPSKGRQKVLDGIKRTLEQLKSETPVKAPSKWAVVNNGIARITVRIGQRIVPIEGNGINHVPESQVAGFFAELTRAVEAGELDQEIEAALASKSGQTSASTGKATRTLSEESRLNIRVGGFRRGGMADDEITAKLKAEGIAADLIKKAVERKKA